MRLLNTAGVLLYTFILIDILFVDILECKYQYKPEMKAWIAQYKTIATWDEALLRCESEGAVLMSPLRKELVDKMRVLLKHNPPHFIGTHSKFHPQLFVSIEGVLIEDMPVSNMYEQLVPEQGQCLSMNYDHIQIVSCSSMLPYMCYKEESPNYAITECGTFDEEYKLINLTAHCYKFHTEYKSWSEAYMTCTAEGGYLAIPNNEAEAKEILEIISTNKVQYVYIGIHDWRGNGDWRSIHGVPIELLYNSWESEKTPKEACCEDGAMNPSTGNLKNFDSSTMSYFICEKEPNNMKFVYNA